ncbi:MAG: hypothetical protein ACK5H2_04570 [Beutenbergiaceae bacterium]
MVIALMLVVMAGCSRESDALLREEDFPYQVEVRVYPEDAHPDEYARIPQFGSCDNLGLGEGTYPSGGRVAAYAVESAEDIAADEWREAFPTSISAALVLTDRGSDQFISEWEDRILRCEPQVLANLPNDTIGWEQTFDDDRFGYTVLLMQRMNDDYVLLVGSQEFGTIDIDTMALFDVVSERAQQMLEQ